MNSNGIAVIVTNSYSNDSLSFIYVEYIIMLLGVLAIRVMYNYSTLKRYSVQLVEMVFSKNVDCALQI